MSNFSFDVVKPYVLNFLKRHFWKIESYMDWEDAVAEAQLQFIRTLNRLDKRNCIIENEKHLMSLFKTSWSNHFITLANKATKQRFVSNFDTVETWNLAETSIVGDYDNNGAVEILLQQAPPEVKQVLQLMLSAPDELFNTLQLLFMENPNLCNIFLCKLLNKNPQVVNLLTSTLEHLKVE